MTAHESPTSVARETNKSPENLEASLSQALTDFYDLSFEPDFEAMCADRRIAPDDTDQPFYWQAAAIFAADRAAKLREQGQDEKQLAMTELFAATPAFIYDNMTLNHYGKNAHRHVPDGEFKDAKAGASYFNSLLRHTASLWPELRASQLQSNLLNVANISLEDPAAQRQADKFINACVRGAQHETAFDQLLDVTGRDHREATVDEDLHGIDKVVARPDGSEDYIDVKASLSEIESRGQHKQPFAKTPDGHLVMYSMVTDKELNDHFYVPASVAQQRGALLDQLLDEAAPVSRVV